MKKALLFVLVAACVCKTTGSFGQVNVQDSLALVNLYDSTGGVNWTNNSGWLDGPVLYWHGISLDGTGTRVAGISLGSNNLVGTIPLSLADVTALTTLDLNTNQLVDTIPSFIWNLINLTSLNLSSNQFTGSISPEIGNLTNLISANLSSNQLTGIIPSSIGNLINLQSLYLNNNQLTGSIPSSIGITGLQLLFLNNNQLTDSIPSSIGNCTRMGFLYLNNNQLSGSLPSSLGNLSWMQHFYLNNNQLSGSIPSTYGNLGGFEGEPVYDFDLSDNQLSGSIPQSLLNDYNIISLDLSNNQLSGNLPQFTLTILEALYLNNNQLSGSIPTSIGNLSYLITLDLSFNQLNSSIPSAFGSEDYTELEYVDISNNKLTGSISASFASYIANHPPAVYDNTYYNFSNNQLSGTIPSFSSSGPGQHNAIVDLDSNQFTFNGMEMLAEEVSQDNFSATYAPQAFIPLHYSGGQYSVSAGGTLSNNTYNWYKDGTLVATNVGDSTYTPSGGGSYSVAVTNSIVTNPASPGTDLILYSDSIKVGLDSSIIMPDHPLVEYANRQYVNASGWTDYYWDNNTPNDYTDDTLLLSLNTNGQNIGTIGDGTFAVKLVATAGAGSNTGIELTNPLITNPSGFWVMNRYWEVTPTTEPTASVGVRFYYNNQDLADVNGSYPDHDLTNQKLIFYKEIGGNPDPTTNLAGATGLISILPSTYASDTTWTYHQLTDSTQYAEFSVASFSGGGGGGTGNDEALPIKLLSFTATKEGGKNLLQWTTTNEVNSSYFEVERSDDGVEFTSIGQVDAAGNSSVAKSYSLVDAKPVNGMNYYRLKMMDKDGQFSYSMIRTINETVSFAASIYPNPVQNILNLSFNSDKAETVQVVLVDNGGKVVATQEVEVAAGASTESINVGGLSSGEYYVRVVSSEGEVEERFVKE